MTRTGVKERRLSVSSLLRSFDVDVVNVPSPNEPAFVSHLSKLKPDIVFNAGSRYLKAPCWPCHARAGSTVTLANFPTTEACSLCSKHCEPASPLSR